MCSKFLGILNNFSDRSFCGLHLDIRAISPRKKYRSTLPSNSDQAQNIFVFCRRIVINNRLGHLNTIELFAQKCR